MFAENMILILLRPTANTIFGQPDQLTSVPVGQGFNGTNFYARGSLAFGRSCDTEIAFHDIRFQRIIIFKRRNLKRAGHHTIAATDAHVRVPQNRTALLLGKGAHDASACTSRMITMHALHFDMRRHRFSTGIFIDYGERIFTWAALRLKNGSIFVCLDPSCRNPVRVLACPLAISAANANRRVDQHAHSIGRDDVLGCRFGHFRRNQRRQSQCGCDLQKSPSALFYHKITRKSGSEYLFTVLFVFNILIYFIKISLFILFHNDTYQYYPSRREKTAELDGCVVLDPDVRVEHFRRQVFRHHVDDMHARNPQQLYRPIPFPRQFRRD